MKNIRINIDDRIYNNLKEYCDYNKLKINKYITDCIEKALYIDKYGDLNTIFNSESIIPQKTVTAKLEEKQENAETVNENKTRENCVGNVLEASTDGPQAIVKRIKRQLKRK